MNEIETEELTGAINNIAAALRLLGNADACTPMGALEAYGAVVLEASQTIYSGLHEVAEAIQQSAITDRETKP